MDDNIVRRHSKRVANAMDKKDKDKIKRRGNNLSTIYCDFSRLEMTSLKKYVQYFQLQIRQNASKDELVQCVVKHFSVKPKLREAEVISHFLYNTRYSLPFSSHNIGVGGEENNFLLL